MSKNYTDGLTRSGTGCFIAVPIMATVGIKGLTTECSWYQYTDWWLWHGAMDGRLAACVTPTELVVVWRL